MRGTMSLLLQEKSKNPQHNIGLSLFLGTLIVTVIYVCANLMYVAVLPLNEIAHAEKDRIAVSGFPGHFW